MVSMMAASVAGSRALVGSSRRRIGAFFRKARAMPMALALADAEVAAAFADGAVEALGHVHDEVVGLGAFGGLDDFLVGGTHAAVGDVFLSRSWRRESCPEGPCRCGCGGIFCDVADVVAVDPDGARGGVVESRNEA